MQVAGGSCYMLRLVLLLQMADHADENMLIAACSASTLYPCNPDVDSAQTSGVMQQQPMTPQQGPADISKQPANPLYNTKALQLWVLKACQQVGLQPTLCQSVCLL